MNHTDHVNLIRGGIISGTWADFGSGTGAFTLALADLLGKDGVIYSIDKDQAALREQESAMQARFPHAKVYYRHLDFRQNFQLPPLDGVLMANSLHFYKHKEALLATIRAFIRPGGQFVLVEYNTDRGNQWVPHPLSYHTWSELAPAAGFRRTSLLGTHPSRFLGEFFSAVSEN